jgi:hypothetical protein
MQMRWAMKALHPLPVTNPMSNIVFDMAAAILLNGSLRGVISNAPAHNNPKAQKSPPAACVDVDLILFHLPLNRNGVRSG